jgi:hypothetical protein
LLALALHPGLDLLAHDVAVRSSDDKGVPGARFAVALSDALLKKCSISREIPSVRAGKLTVLRGSERPERGSLLRSDEPSMRARRALAKAIEPVTSFELTPYELEPWSRRWL